MHTDKQLIDILGTRKTARDLGISVSRVSHWKRRGIPWSMRYKVAEYAGSMGINLDTDFLGERK